MTETIDPFNAEVKRQSTDVRRNVMRLGTLFADHEFDPARCNGVRTDLVHTLRTEQPDDIGLSAIFRNVTRQKQRVLRDAYNRGTNALTTVWKFMETVHGLHSRNPSVVTAPQASRLILLGHENYTFLASGLVLDKEISEQGAIAANTGPVVLPSRRQGTGSDKREERLKETIDKITVMTQLHEHGLDPKLTRPTRVPLPTPAIEKELKSIGQALVVQQLGYASDQVDVARMMMNERLVADAIMATPKHDPARMAFASYDATHRGYLSRSFPMMIANIHGSLQNANGLNNALNGLALTSP